MPGSIPICIRHVALQRSCRSSIAVVFLIAASAGESTLCSLEKFDSARRREAQSTPQKVLPVARTHLHQDLTQVQRGNPPPHCSVTTLPHCMWHVSCLGALVQSLPEWRTMCAARQTSGRHSSARGAGPATLQREVSCRAGLLSKLNIEIEAQGRQTRTCHQLLLAIPGF